MAKPSFVLAVSALAWLAPAVVRAEDEPAASAPPPSGATEQAASVDEPPWASSSDSALDGDESGDPPGYARTNLLVVGAAATVGFYGLAFGTSYLWPSSPVAEDLRIPVIGPYSAVFGAGCGDRERDCGTFTAVIRTTLAGVSALGQTGGVLLLAEALFLSTDRATTAATSPTVEPTYYAAPIVDDRTIGVTLGGSF